MKTIFFLSLFSCQLLFAQTAENLFTRERGVTISDFSSSYGGGWDVENLVPSVQEMKENNRPVSSYVWCSADNSFPQWATFTLRESTWITTLVFNNAIEDEEGYPGISAKDVEVWISKNGQLKKWASFRLQRNKNGQETKIEPIQTDKLKVVITSNWGNPSWTEFNAMGVYDDGARPKELASELANNQEVNLYGLYFDFGSATLRAESQPTIDQLVDYLNKFPEVRLKLEGHTDQIGSAEANKKLSEARAKAVVERLKQLGVQGSRMQYEGLGASKPIADNATEVGRSKNRRVSVSIVK